jgi:hypothetical protein
MRKVLISLLLFIIGLVCGILIMAQLSMKASTVYLDVVFSNQGNQLEKKGDEAVKAGQFAEASNYYRSQLQLSEIKPEISSKNVWNLDFPVAAVILGEMASAVDPTGAGGKRTEGVKHGKLGLALEKAGNEAEANKEYEKAAGLIGFSEVAAVKRLVKSVLHIKEEEPATPEK